MMDKIRGSCTPQLSSSESAALPSSDFTEKDLHEFFADRDPNCQRALAQSFVNQLQICPPSGCTAGQKSPACEKFQSDSIASLAKFRGSLVSEMPTLQASLTEPCRDRADALRAVQPLKDELRGAHACEPMAPGSERTYPQDLQTVPVANSAYKMSRLPDANGQAVYEARLNLDFKPKPGVDLTAFHQRLSSCLDQVNSKKL